MPGFIRGGDGSLHPVPPEGVTAARERIIALARALGPGVRVREAKGLELSIPGRLFAQCPGFRAACAPLETETRIRAGRLVVTIPALVKDAPILYPD